MDRERATIKKVYDWFRLRHNHLASPEVLTTSMGSVDRKIKGSPFDDGF